ncbi:TPA: Ger(x)C family spore germination protein [Bacillus thuringiensis]|nr:Ger(x)C family spore germination protein [Bacillus thuringiensis]
MQHIKLIIAILCLVFCSSCQDQYLLKDVSLVSSMTFDLTEEGKLLNTVSLPRIPNDKFGKANVLTVSAIGNTPRENQTKIDAKISGTLDISKLRLLVLGEHLAKENILPNLDSFYRDPKSPLTAQMVLAEGKASDVLKLKVADETISDYLSRLLQSAENSTLLPHKQMQSIRSELLDPGQDFLLPYIKIDKIKNIINIKGLAMFDGDKYSGKFLSPVQSTLYLLLLNKKGKSTRFTEKINNSHRPVMRDYITVDLKKMQRKLILEVNKSNKITATIDLNLKMEATEYPSGYLNSKQQRKHLSKELSQKFTHRAENIINKMQRANCDGFGIGRNLIASHPKTWRRIQWKKDYSKVKFIPRVQVEIIDSGIVD